MNNKNIKPALWELWLCAIPTSDESQNQMSLYIILNPDNLLAIPVDSEAVVNGLHNTHSTFIGSGDHGFYVWFSEITKLQPETLKMRFCTVSSFEAKKINDEFMAHIHTLVQALDEMNKSVSGHNSSISTDKSSDTDFTHLFS